MKQIFGPHSLFALLVYATIAALLIESSLVLAAAQRPVVTMHQRWRQFEQFNITSAPSLPNPEHVIAGQFEHDSTLKFLHAKVGTVLASFPLAKVSKSTPKWNKDYSLLVHGDGGGYFHVHHGVQSSSFSRKCSVFIGGSLEGSPEVDNNDIAYIASTNKQVAAVNLVDCSVRWNVSVNGSVIANLKYRADGRVYVATTGGTMYQLSALDGHMLTPPYQTALAQAIVALSLSNDGDILFASSLDNKTYARIATTLGHAWTDTADGPIHAPTLVRSDNKLVICATDGDVLLLNTTGSILQRRNLGAPLYACTLNGDNVLASTGAGMTVEINGTTWSITRSWIFGNNVTPRVVMGDDYMIVAATGLWRLGLCPPFFECELGVGPPRLCNAGYLCRENTWQATQCPAGGWCSANATEVVGCWLGHYCGQGCTAPQPCSPGTWSNSTSATGADTCRPCLKGHTCPSPGMTASLPCSKHTFNPYEGSSTAGACVACAAGKVCAESSVEPTPCDANSFCPANNDPQPCPQYASSLAGSSALSDCFCTHNRTADLNACPSVALQPVPQPNPEPDASGGVPTTLIVILSVGGAVALVVLSFAVVYFVRRRKGMPNIVRQIDSRPASRSGSESSSSISLAVAPNEKPLDASSPDFSSPDLSSTVLPNAPLLSKEDIDSIPKFGAVQRTQQIINRMKGVLELVKLRMLGSEKHAARIVNAWLREKELGRNLERMQHQGAAALQQAKDEQQRLIETLAQLLKKFGPRVSSWVVPWRFKEPLLILLADHPILLAAMVDIPNVNVNVVTEFGTSALHRAVAVWQCVELLLSHGAAVNVVDNDGNSPLHMVGAISDESAQILVNNGARLHDPNKRGETPLVRFTKLGKLGPTQAVVENARLTESESVVREMICPSNAPRDLNPFVQAMEEFVCAGKFQTLFTDKENPRRPLAEYLCKVMGMSLEQGVNFMRYGQVTVQPATVSEVLLDIQDELPVRRQNSAELKRTLLQAREKDEEHKTNDLQDILETPNARDESLIIAAISDGDPDSLDVVMEFQGNPDISPVLRHAQNCLERCTEATSPDELERRQRCLQIVANACMDQADEILEPKRDPSQALTIGSGGTLVPLDHIRNLGHKPSFLSWTTNAPLRSDLAFLIMAEAGNRAPLEASSETKSVVNLNVFNNYNIVMNTGATAAASHGRGSSQPSQLNSVTIEEVSDDDDQKDSGLHLCPPPLP